jgi:hypothetical protein
MITLLIFPLLPQKVDTEFDGSRKLGESKGGYVEYPPPPTTPHFCTQFVFSSLEIDN